MFWGETVAPTITGQHQALEGEQQEAEMVRSRDTAATGVRHKHCPGLTVLCKVPISVL